VDTFSSVCLFLVLIGIILMLVSTATVGARTAATVAAINRKLELLMKHSGMNFTEVVEREVRPVLHASGKIHAIKRYREITGAGLAEAKTEVERIMREGAGPA
jgi:ribosomal protein L7/L12